MKHHFANKELCHRFMHQSPNDYGNGSHLFYDHNLLFSYGRHYCAANLQSDKKIIIVNARRYSNSTAKHLSHLSNAITPDLTIYYSNRPESIELTAEYLYNEIFECLDVTFLSRSEMGGANRALETYNNFCKAFRIQSKMKVFPKSFIDLLGEIASEKALIQTKNEAARIKRNNTLAFNKREKMLQREQDQLKNYDTKLNEWLQFKRNDLPYMINYPISLRFNKELNRIETSRGANVPYDNHLKALSTHSKESFQKYKEVIIGKHFGIYKIDDITNENIIVGCHTINIDYALNFLKTIPERELV